MGRLRGRREVSHPLVRELLFADDSALAAHTLSDAQRIMDCFATAARRFGLTISIKETEFIHQSARGQLATPRAISVEYYNINCVKSLCYLGSTLYPQTRR